jgi:hypothetical protein
MQCRHAEHRDRSTYSGIPLMQMCRLLQHDMYGRDICRLQRQIAALFLVLTVAEALRDCFVNTRLGAVKGSTEKSRNGKPFCSFRGIPYAAPPIGELRFKVSNSVFGKKPVV